MAPSQKLTGGCQCGAVRFEWVEPPQYASVCYCRMCQKASGQPFMALAGGAKERLRWTKGAPSIFQSSNIAERGFCAQCGTQLTYRSVDSGNISVAMGSFDDPEAVRPTKQYGVESKVSWLDTIFSLPAQRTDEWMSAADTARFQNCQHPDKS
jgi:hypothetical protein